MARHQRQVRLRDGRPVLVLCTTRHCLALLLAFQISLVIPDLHRPLPPSPPPRSHVEKSYEAVPAIFERLFGRWHSTTLAISGDQTSHLLWRLRNGEIPSAASPKAVVVHIGTNDLTMHASQSARAQTGTALQRRAAVAEKAPLVVQGVRHVATVLKRRMPSAVVLLSMILPRGTHYNKTGGDLTQPGLYSDAIKAVNLGLVDLASSMGLHTVDCGPLFLTADGNLNQTLMTDGLHPSPMGYEKWGQCHFKALEDLLA